MVERVDVYERFGWVCYYFSEYVKVKEYNEKVFVVLIECNDRVGIVLCYGNLGMIFLFFGEYVKVEEYLEKVFVIMEDIGYK